MPRTYDTAQELEAAKTALKTQTIGVQIHLLLEDGSQPEGGWGGLRDADGNPVQSVTWRYAVLDDAGAVVRIVEYTESFAQVLGEDAGYGAVYAAIKAHSYLHDAGAAGLPAGGVVT